MPETPPEIRPAAPAAGPVSIFLESLGIAVVLGAALLLWVLSERGVPKPQPPSVPVTHANGATPQANGSASPHRTVTDSTPVAKGAVADRPTPTPVDATIAGNVVPIDPFARADAGPTVVPTAGAEEPESKPNPPSGPKPTTIAGTHDLRLTSWQDPFDSDLWTSDGWSFANGAMSTDAGEPASGVFKRTYKELMLDLHVAPTAAFGEFEVRLTAPATGGVLQLVLTDRGIVLKTPRPGRAGVGDELRRKEFDPEATVATPGRLRFAATGNRILVYWNDRRLFSCDQPANQSGRELTLSLHARDRGLKIVKLRIEGE